MIMREAHERHKEVRRRMGCAVAKAAIVPRDLVAPAAPPTKIEIFKKVRVRKEIHIYSYPIGPVKPVIVDRLMMSDIKKTVAGVFGVTVAHLTCRQRPRGEVTDARHVAMFFCRHLLRRSWPEIGAAFGGRDHTTVLSAVRRIEKVRGAGGELADMVTTIERMLR